MLHKVSVIFCLVLLTSSCNKREGNGKHSEGFRWKESISVKDIPDIPVNGYLKGKEIGFGYINFERWRGSNDNVINFSQPKPLQNCGYIEGFRGFSLIRKGGDFTLGEWLKADFAGTGNEEAYYIDSGVRSECEWNCALKIDEITNKYVRGSLVMFFNDASKSWIAGSFEAVVCNN